MIKMIKLPYSIDSLEPYYSAETLDLHYNILYKGYVDNTNSTLAMLDNARKTGDFSNIKCLEKNLSFFGSGAILHQLFFENLGADIPVKPSLKLMKQISQDFGNFDNPVGLVSCPRKTRDKERERVF